MLFKKEPNVFLFDFLKGKQVYFLLPLTKENSADGYKIPSALDFFQFRGFTRSANGLFDRCFIRFALSDYSGQSYLRYIYTVKTILFIRKARSQIATGLFLSSLPNQIQKLFHQSIQINRIRFRISRCLRFYRFIRLLFLIFFALCILRERIDIFHIFQLFFTHGQTFRGGFPCL